MKKFLLSSVALLSLTAGAMAADLPSRQAPAPMISAVPIFTWTGFYVGAQVGYGWNDSENNLDGVGTVFTRDAAGVLVPTTLGFGDSGDDDGFLAGVHAGYNFQFGSFVVGIEGDVEGVFGDDDDDNFGNVVYLNAAGQPIAYSFAGTTLDWQASIRARAGFAFDRLLIYGTGGFAFGGLSGGFNNSTFFDNDDDTITGWTLGAGVEWAFTNNITTRLEYRYTSFEGNESFFNNVAIGGDDIDFHTVRLGVSFKF